MFSSLKVGFRKLVHRAMYFKFSALLHNPPSDLMAKFHRDSLLNTDDV
jgi:hypothetical protein